jgi:hypothetical protein
MSRASFNPSTRQRGRARWCTASCVLPSSALPCFRAKLDRPVTPSLLADRVPHRARSDHHATRRCRRALDRARARAAHAARAPRGAAHSGHVLARRRGHAWDCLSFVEAARARVLRGGAAALTARQESTQAKQVRAHGAQRAARAAIACRARPSPSQAARTPSAPSARACARRADTRRLGSSSDPAKRDGLKAIASAGSAKDAYMGARRRRRLRPQDHRCVRWPQLPCAAPTSAQPRRTWSRSRTGSTCVCAACDADGAPADTSTTLAARRSTPRSWPRTSTRASSCVRAAHTALYS